ncbi:ammonium transporter [Guillardia theta CCMP2712]|uniref:Ammonium transporter n=1 Tax=Guillardia theta (strain CCMP2712) TaxID=905079 RepID=L1IUV5_GUITC|nr:ammonium transporter [Guillardia theta CCMP2712]EKX40018.1 ammonium transporter [Guillardia theta CCMP2712]|eukprot:XP_005826998.1 ammonium transporter [Guillardia theta CCMP2712]
MLEQNAKEEGDIAFMLISTALVLMMTIPGLALFYGGLARAPNVLSTVMQSFAITCLVSVLWIIAGYSLCFDAGNPFIGGANKFWLTGVYGSMSGSIPEVLFVMYQATFAIITCAIITGSFAERMRFAPTLIFVGIWHLIVYCPIAHWEWGGGFMSQWHVLDFAGGDVVHISSGASGLAASIIVGKRKGFGQGQELPPHNILLVFLGASLLWVGWFGFNAGSAIAANEQASIAMLVTHVSAAAGGFSWMLTEWIFRKKPSVLGAVSGAIAGLVVITPGSGYVNHTGAFVMGLIAGPFCYFSIQLKHILGFDDALDAFGVHGVGGMLGGILTGCFADAAIGGQNGAFYGNPKQLGIQLAGIAVTLVYSIIMTFIILKPLDLIWRAATGNGIRVTEEEEDRGLDLSEHGESMLFDSAHAKLEPDQTLNVGPFESRVYPITVNAE